MSRRLHGCHSGSAGQEEGQLKLLCLVTLRVIGVYVWSVQWMDISCLTHNSRLDSECHTLHNGLMEH